MVQRDIAGFWLVSLLAVACGRAESRRTGGARPAVSATAPPEPAALSASAPPDLVASAPAEAIVALDGDALLRVVRERGRRGAIVNIWASWCGPCRRELPMLRGLAENVKARGLDVILVSVDEPEAHAEMQRMLELEGYSPPFYVARRPLGPFKRALHPRWPGMIPVTFLFDGAGARRYFWGGPVHEHELVPVIDGFLAGEAIDGEARYELAPGQTTP